MEHHKYTKTAGGGYKIRGELECVHNIWSQNYILTNLKYRPRAAIIHPYSHAVLL